MILTDDMLLAAIDSGQVKIEPFDRGNIQPASYDLSVGSEAIVSSVRKKINLQESGFVEIGAGDLSIIVSEETITLDNQHVGRFGLRSKWARKGLVATTGPQIDPGFNGNLKVGITNLTNKKISLSHLDHFLTMEIHKLSQPANKTYTGPYQNQTSLGPDDLDVVLDREVMSLSEIHQTLRSLSVNVSSLEKSVSSMRWFIGLGITIIGIIVALK